MNDGEERKTDWLYEAAKYALLWFDTMANVDTLEATIEVRRRLREAVEWFERKGKE